MLGQARAAKATRLLSKHSECPFEQDVYVEGLPGKARVTCCWGTAVTLAFSV